MLCARDARDRGVAVLRARCDELAMQSGFVAVRELLWSEVHRDLGILRRLRSAGGAANHARGGRL